MLEKLVSRVNLLPITKSLIMVSMDWFLPQDPWTSVPHTKSFSIFPNTSSSWKVCWRILCWLSICFWSATKMLEIANWWIACCSWCNASGWVTPDCSFVCLFVCLFVFACNLCACVWFCGMLLNRNIFSIASPRLQLEKAREWSIALSRYFGLVWITPCLCHEIRASVDDWWSW